MSYTKAKLLTPLITIIHHRNVMRGPINIERIRMEMHQKVGLKSRTKATSKQEWTKILKYLLDSGSMIETIKLKKKLMVMVMQKL